MTMKTDCRKILHTITVMGIRYKVVSLAALLITLISGGPGADRAMTQAVSYGAVRALFNFAIPGGGPFPTDWFTVADQSHLTGQRIALPYPDCNQRPSDCEDRAVLNTLDGFNLQPRLSIPFDGSIDVTTVNSRTVFLITLPC